MKFIKKYVWVVLLVFVLVCVSGYFGYNAFSTRVVNESNEKAAKLNVEINSLKNKVKSLEKERGETLIEKTEIEKRYNYLKENPPKPPKQKPIYIKGEKEIVYVKADDYKETEKNLSDCISKFNKSMNIFSDLGINYNTYIFKTEKIEEKTEKIETKTEKKSTVFKDARDLLASRNKSVSATLSISAMGVEAGLYNLNDTMSFYKNIEPEPYTVYLTSPGLDTNTKAVKFAYVFYFLKVEACLFRKDIIRKDLIK